MTTGTPSLQLERPGRSPRMLAWFLIGTAGLIAATTALTIHLTAQAVRDRVQVEVEQTAELVGGSGFPLTDPAMKQIADFMDADVVAVDAEGRVVVSSLDPQRRTAFEALAAADQLPAVPGDGARLQLADLGAGPVTVGVAPVKPNPTLGAGGAVYVLYPGDLVTAQARQAWLPVTVVAAIALLLAALLGVVSERFVQRARTAALLQLLVSVAHEIRNPLGAIRTLAATIKARNRGSIDPRPLDVIAAEADRLTLLVEGLRTIGLPVRTLQREIAPDQAVRQVLGLLQHQLEHRRIEVETALESEEVRVLADPAHVRQVVLNLLINASEAQPRGGRVRLASRVLGSTWELTIKDSGPGVPPEVRSRLFTPFFTTKPKGLGVGLYMSRRLARANGGDLELDLPSTDSPGARFLLTWPRAARSQERVSALQEQ